MAVCPNCGESNPERAKFCLECATPLVAQRAPPHEARKTITVLFCDLVGSTALGERLDSESLREVMDRYFAEMKRIVERHGGIVEKYIGDAVMALFGLPRAHEDDALRAVRAASEMGLSLATLNSELDRHWNLTLANRIGVNTGEVVVGDPSSGQRLATGDTVNVAARLEQAASAGSVLLGEPTYQLVRDAAEVEAVESLALKGKSERLPAYQVVAVKPTAEGVTRRLHAPLVGREGEVASLMDAFQRAVRDKSCHLVAVLGEAGVGKSRLVEEVTQRLAGDATILRGRCLSYGEGITFWPVVEAIREAARISEQDSVTAARGKIASLAASDKEIGERVQALLGLSDGSYAIEESFWAVRRLLEDLAMQRPLLVVIEDLHWAEPTLLDLLTHVVELTGAAPILLVCTARKEGFKAGSDWLDALSDATLLALEPLTTEDSQTLIHTLLGSPGLDADARDRITEAAQGNPLFVEQMLSMWLDERMLTQHDGRWSLSQSLSEIVIPPTLSALFSARLDRLDQHERTIIAGASVVGQIFYRGAVQQLCPPALRRAVTTKIAALITKEFIRPDEATLFHDEAFAFRHILIRNAAYEAMLKRTRATLHERFATWLEDVIGDRVSEYVEIVGYHLEQAYLYSLALGRKDDRIEKVGRRAAHHLTSAGKRALNRGDMSGAANLLQRAVALLPQDDPDQAVVLPDLAVALVETGEFTKADSVLADTLDVAARRNDEVVHWYARLERIRLGVLSQPEGMYQQALRDAEQAIPFFEALGDERGLAKTRNLAAHAHKDLGKVTVAEEAWRRAAEHAEAAGDRRELADSLSWLALAARFGPSPAPHGIEACDRILDKAQGDRKVHAYVLDARCVLEAMLGRFSQARQSARTAQDLYTDLGLKVMGANLPQNSGYVEMLAGDAVAAEREYRRGYELLDNLGERGFLSVVAGLLADALYCQGRFGEAEEFTRVTEEAAASDDVSAQALWRSVRAKVMAQRGERERADNLAREAVRLVDETETIDDQADFRMSLGEVLRLQDRLVESVEVVEEALRLYGQKGNIVSAARARKLLEHLTGGATHRQTSRPL